MCRNKFIVFRIVLYWIMQAGNDFRMCGSLPGKIFAWKVSRITYMYVWSEGFDLYRQSEISVFESAGSAKRHTF